VTQLNSHNPQTHLRIRLRKSHRIASPTHSVAPYPSAENKNSPKHLSAYLIREQEDVVLLFLPAIFASFWVLPHRTIVAARVLAVRPVAEGRTCDVCGFGLVVPFGGREPVEEGRESVQEARSQVVIVSQTLRTLARNACARPSVTPSLVPSPA